MAGAELRPTGRTLWGFSTGHLCRGHGARPLRAAVLGAAECPAASLVPRLNVRDNPRDNHRCPRRGHGPQVQGRSRGDGSVGRVLLRREPRHRGLEQAPPPALPGRPRARAPTHATRPQVLSTRILAMKASLCKLSPCTVARVCDYHAKLFLAAVSSTLKSLLRPHTLNTPDKSPGDRLAEVCAKVTDVGADCVRRPPRAGTGELGMEGEVGRVPRDSWGPGRTRAAPAPLGPGQGHRAQPAGTPRGSGSSPVLRGPRLSCLPVGSCGARPPPA